MYLYVLIMLRLHAFNIQRAFYQLQIKIHHDSSNEPFSVKNTGGPQVGVCGLWNAYRLQGDPEE